MAHAQSPLSPTYAHSTNLIPCIASSNEDPWDWRHSDLEFQSVFECVLTFCYTNVLSKPKWVSLLQLECMWGEGGSSSDGHLCVQTALISYKMKSVVIWFLFSLYFLSPPLPSLWLLSGHTLTIDLSLALQPGLTHLSQAHRLAEHWS